MKKEKLLNLILIYSILFFISILIYTSWVSDDAYITFRTVDNFLNGFGLRWNIAERVQSYTHPLWMFLLVLAGTIIKNPFISSLFLSYFFVFGTLYLIIKKGLKNKINLTLAIFTLSCSKAFIDYSTSGLENPLSYFLFTVFCLKLFEIEKPNLKNIFHFSLIASLIMLNRLDLSLILFPTFCYFLTFIYKKKILLKGSLVIFAGFLPLIIWEVFSIIYYGFPFPNTAYAKLASVIPLKQQLIQGLNYFKNSFFWDPLTLIIIVSSVFVSIVNKKRSIKLITFGIILYLIYIVKIGGDFMSGRFFTIPFLIGVLILMFQNINSKKMQVLSLLIVLITGSYQFYNTNFNNIKNIHKFDNGIADERLYYYDTSGLIPCIKTNFHPTHSRAILGNDLNKYQPKVVEKGAVGMFAYYAGPNVFVVDQYGLCDTLLARLPKMEYYFRIGHIRHLPPFMYLQSLENNKNLLFDKNLKEFYEKLRIITRNPLFSKSRFKTILKFNLNKYSHLINKYEKSPVIANYNILNKPIIKLNAWKNKEIVNFTSKGLLIPFEKPIKGNKVKLSIDVFNTYEIYFYNGDLVVGKDFLPTGGMVEGDIVNIELQLKENLTFNKILIKPMTKVGANSIGFFGVFDKFDNLIKFENSNNFQITLTDKMKKTIFNYIENNDFLFVDRSGIYEISKNKVKQISINSFKNKIIKNKYIYLIVAKTRTSHTLLNEIYNLSSINKIKMVEDNITYSIFKIENIDVFSIKSEKDYSIFYKWNVFSNDNLTIYKNKKVNFKSYLLFNNSSFDFAVTKENSSCILLFGNDKVWNDNAGYINVENANNISIVITGKSLSKPFNLFPFVAFYDKFGKRIKTVNGNKIHFSKEGDYRIYFQMGKDSFSIPFLKTPNNAINMAIGFNFYKDKGILNVKELKVFKN